MRKNAAQVVRDLAQIPVSQRDPFHYIEQAKVAVDRGRVVYWTASGGQATVQQSANIPYANLAVLLLGPGCSITSEAAELLASTNVVVGFTGGAGAPLNAAIDPVAFSTGVSEYRPTEYMQRWASWWFDEKRRLDKARQLLTFRARLIEDLWSHGGLQDALGEQAKRLLPSAAANFFGATADRPAVGGIFSKAPKENAADYAERLFGQAQNEPALLGCEGRHVKSLYQFMARHFALEFERREQRASDSVVNRYLTMGNYIAYGLAASALHALGISFAFPLLHGKTRRGALVFDVADPIKDAVIVPAAFACAAQKYDEAEFRRRIKTALMRTRALSRVVDEIKRLSGAEHA